MYITVFILVGAGSVTILIKTIVVLAAKVVTSLCYLHGISQNYAKMQFCKRCKRENEIYLNKLSDKKCANRFLH